MKFKLLIALVSLFQILSVKSEVSFVDKILDQQTNEYLEDRDYFQKINIHTKESPLAKSKEEKELFSFEQWEKLREDNLGAIDLGKDIALNKIGGLATGVIDVTHQVKRGVKSAIQESFGGYAEYQRRKQVEEIANSTFINRKLLGDLFIRNNNEDLGMGFQNKRFSFTSFNEKTYSYKLIREIVQNETIKNLREVIIKVTMFLLMLMITIKILVALKHGNSVIETFTRPLINLVLALIAIGAGYKFLSLNLNLANKLAKAFTMMLYDFKAESLMNPSEAWTSYAQDFGYFPTMVLAVFDMLSQVFIGFFYIAIIAFIVFGMIFYPFWIIFSVFQTSRLVFIESYINWIKANLVLVFSPILIIIFRIISLELSNDYIFMSILAKTLSFYSLPLLMYFIFLKANPTIDFDYEKIDYSSQLKEEIRDLLAIKNA